MKILVIQHKMIGDVLTSSILFEALRNKYPGAELHYLIQAHTQPVVENNPFVDNFLLIEPADSILSLVKRVRKEKYELVIDAYSKINSALVTAFSGAEKRISYYKKYTSAAYSDTVDPGTSVKTEARLAIENRMLLLQPISKEFPSHLKPKIYLTDEEICKSRSFIKQNGISLEDPLLMVSISGSCAAKTYPVEYMAKVLDFVVQKCQAQIVFNYLPQQEKEAGLLYNLCGPTTQKQIFYRAHGESLREFIAITSLCDAVIGNEGGAVNIAKALEIPTFSIFSPGVKKEVWSTYEDGSKQVSVHVEDYIQITRIYSLGKNWRNRRYYRKFKPRLFLNKLELFLEENIGKRKDTRFPS